jgi:hypothetical protein
MLYRGCITVKRLIKENMYVTVEADTEEEALKELKDGNYEYEDSEEVDDLGVVEILNREITDVYE